MPDDSSKIPVNVNSPTTVSPPPAATPPSPNPPVQPSAPAHVKSAHRFLLLYITVLLAALLAGGVYAWQNSKVKDLKQKDAYYLAQVSQLKKQLADTEASLPTNSNAGNAPNNPYADWKTFCDNFSNACLRYPKDWQ